MAAPSFFIIAKTIKILLKHALAICENILSHNILGFYEGRQYFSAFSVRFLQVFTRNTDMI